MKVLVAEDEEVNVLLLTSRLERRGYEVSLAENGKIAIEKARSDKPDIILLDMRMPVMGGLEAIKLIRCDSDLKDIPVIGVSAHALDEDIQNALTAGCNDYITKPIDFSKLWIAMDRWK